jgi:UPF0176 protein
MKNLKFTIITFYQFKESVNVNKIQMILKDFCSFNKIKGTVILAKEGINGTVAGLIEPIKLLEDELIKIGYLNLEKKKSTYDFMPFNRLKIKKKKEIVTFNEEDLNVEKLKGQHVNSENWNELIQDKETIILDVRNNFEVEIGSFKGAVNPNTENFSEFKDYVKKNLKEHKNKKIAMFCTGGIRCEKASSYMLRLGFKNIHQLKGGILKYLEDIKLKESEWEGECFVFDNRVSVRNEMKIGTFELCHACRSPISISDRNSLDFEKGISCSKCKNITTVEKKKRLEERNKQIEIAKKKGLYNPYIKFTPTDFF